MATSRSAAMARLREAGRRHSTAVVLFHTAFAQQSGLTAVEAKTMEIIDRLGPMTHADLVRQTGLAPASVTGLMTRLERKGAARRLPHPGDARRILIEIQPDYAAANLARFQTFLAGLDSIAADFTVEQLDTIATFLDRTAQMQQQQALHLEAGPLP